jgi:hypothetical protein
MEPRRFVFVLGTGRCGSTLVHEVLARHPDVGFVSNLDNRFPGLGVKGRLNGSLYRALPGPVSGFTTSGSVAGWGAPERESGGSKPSLASRMVRRFGPSEAYDLIERQVSIEVRRPERDLTRTDAGGELGARFRRFFEERARAQRRPVFVHHFTGWPRAGFVQEALPGARFVHVVRDGRAVASSLVRTSWWRGHGGLDGWGFGPLPPDYEREWEASGRSKTMLAGLHWKLLMDAFDRARREVPEDRWLEVRFEDLVVAPRDEVARMLALSGLEWTDRFERQFARMVFRPGRRDAFLHELSPDDVALLEQSLRDHLERHGYARVG